MGNQFKWQFDESSDEDPSPGRGPSPSSAGKFWITAVFLAALIVGGWALLRQQQEKSKQTLTAETQAVVNLMRKAVVAGDGELFFSLLDAGPDGFAAQLIPQNSSFYRADPTITNVKQVGEMLHANAVWQENGQDYQRALFFYWRAGQLRQTDTDPAYWGEMKQAQHSWGQLDYFEVDEPWESDIAAFISHKLVQLCADGCPADRLPVQLAIRPDFTQTAEPGHLALPSPRLLGLDQSGEPSSRFWHALEISLADYLAPAAIRFAVPNERSPRIDYAAAASAFTALHPDIQVEIVPVDSMPATEDELAAYDGAAFIPSIEMITGGLVRDLTPFVESDPQFDSYDFYEQIWQGTIWRDRLWAMPQAAEMRLVFYHSDAYEFLDLEKPLIGWTWSEMSSDAAYLPGAKIVTENNLTWGYLDSTFDTLYSYAYSNQSGCSALESRPCPIPLSNEDIVASLEWYTNLSGEEQIMPDLSMMSEEERRLLLINSVFETAIWVDEPLFYEHRTLMFPMNVLPFPGSDRFDSNTPLWVIGSFINQQSEHPLAAWQWLKFLSDWPPLPTYRLIPARPSTSQETYFWTKIPRDLAEPMRAAFPLARPVRIEDRAIFEWPAIRAIKEGELTALEVARTARSYSWFGS